MTVLDAERVSPVHLSNRYCERDIFRLATIITRMAEFDNIYADANPFVRAHFDCPDCDGRLWEYAIQKQMVCENCRLVFRSGDIFEAQV